MDEFDIKLIHFDSVFYLPSSIPLMHIDHSDKNDLFNNVGSVHIRRVFHTETNTEELVRTIHCVPVSCNVCGTDIFLSDTKELVDHVFGQTHIDQFMKVRGSISNKDFSFWTRLLSIFRKDFDDPEWQQQQLLLMSTKLDLHSRLKHFTVEVSSNSDKVTSMNHFISATLARSERVIIYCTNESHCDWIASLINKHYSFSGNESQVVAGARRSSHKEESQSTADGNKPQAILPNPVKIAYAKTKQGLQWKLSMDPIPHKDSPNESVVYLRPPNDSTDSRDPMAALCAFDLCASRIQSSLMMIHGEDQKAAFRAFEMKFMHPNENLLPIYDIHVLILLEDTAKVQAKTKNTVDLSITTPLNDPNPTATVSSATVCSADTISNPGLDTVNIDAELAEIRRFPQDIMKLLYPLDKSVRKTPSASYAVFLTEIEVQIDAREKIIEAFKKRLQEKEEDEKGKRTDDITKALKISGEMGERLRSMREKAQQMTTVTTKITVPEKPTGTMTSTVSKNASGSEKATIPDKPTTYIPRKELKQTIRQQDLKQEDTDGTNEDEKSTVSSQYTVVSPSSSSKMKKVTVAVKSTGSTMKMPEMRTEIWSVTAHCVEGKIKETEPGERKKEKKSRRSHRRKKEWPEIFIPFDEEMGKKVDEIIRMMADSQYLAE